MPTCCEAAAAATDDETRSRTMSAVFLTKDGHRAEEPPHQAFLRRPPRACRADAGRARARRRPRSTSARRLSPSSARDALLTLAGGHHRRSYEARKSAPRRARLRRPRSRARPDLLSPRRRGLGALQARPGHRPHPRRRGAGHERAAVEHPRAHRRGVRRRARAAATASAPSSRWAIPSSRSSPSRAPTRAPSSRRAAISRRAIDGLTAAADRSAGASTTRSCTLSFRSAPDVLQAVDKVFDVAANFRGLSFDDPARSAVVGTTHTSARQGAPGLVEIWEPEKPVVEPDPDAWAKPLDEPDAGAPAVRLADAHRRRSSTAGARRATRPAGASGPATC